MLLLASTSDLLRVITSSNANIDAHVDWVDSASGVITPGRTNTLIGSINTTTILASPASNTYRVVKTITLRNRHASTSCDVTVVHSDGTNIPELVKATLPAGYALHYDEHNGFTLRDGQARIVERLDTLLAASSTTFNTVVLATDVTNNNVVLDTIADVTGLSFAVTSGNTYWFRFSIAYTSAATTTGSRWSINGPTTTTLIYRSEYSLGAASRTINEGLSTYDAPAASNATSAATASNMASIEGIITPSASGTVIARFASEVAASAVVAKAGSVLHWQQVI